MAQQVTHKLIVNETVGSEPKFHIISGNPEIGYDDLFVYEIEHRGHFKRSWQAVACARGESPQV